jgi:hypothetical protein
MAKYSAKDLVHLDLVAIGMFVKLFVVAIVWSLT